MDTKTGNNRVAHLAWCALVALHIARRDGRVTSPAQENLYLTRWLATAEKQRLFCRELAADIGWLLKAGRDKGVSADLPGKFEYLWRTGCGDLLTQKDLFRLQHLLHELRVSGWFYRVLSDSEWTGRRALKLSPGVSGLYLNKNGLDNAFNEQGQQIRPLPLRITGDLAALDALLLPFGWRREPAGQELLHSLFATTDTGI